MNVYLRSNEDLAHFIEKYQHKMPGKKYSQIRMQLRELDHESAMKKRLSRNFRLNCWLSFALIVLSSAGLMIPVSQFAFEAALFAQILFVISILVLVLATRFFIEISKTTSVFTFGKS